MNFSHHRPGLKARAAHISLAAASAAALLTSGVAVLTAMPAQAAIARDVVQALKLRLPKTPIVGRLYDLEERRDVTATRLLELNPDLLAAGAARAAGRAEASHSEAAPAPAKTKVDLSQLPHEGAIRWGNPKGPRLVVFSDFQCGYCKKLTGALEQAGVLVEERPISIFGAASRRLSESVLCASDPVAALHAAYTGKHVPRPASCKAIRALDANEAFAKANGFAGTPVIVRASDGAVMHGYRDAATLNRFANQRAGAGQ